MRFRTRGHAPDSGAEVALLLTEASEAAAHGALDVAIDALGRAALLQPGQAAIHAELGSVLRHAGRIEAARRAYARALDLDPGRADAGRGLRELPSAPPQRANFTVGQELTSARSTKDGTLNRYTVEAVHRGGFGAVYIVRDRAGEILAFKSFDARFLWSDDDRRRFQREAATWISLDPHPHVVKARWAEEIEGFPCLVMEYVEGGDLLDRLESGPLNVGQAVLFGLHLCDGMEHAVRQLGLVHRDLKPSNCMISTDGKLKVTDFGLARGLREAQEASLGLHGAPASVRTLYTTVAGTPVYMPPEQYVQGAELGPWTDVYAFGVMLFQMLTCQLPPPGGLAAAYLDHSPALKALPDRLAVLIRRCVEPDPHRRPAGFGAVRDQLARAYRQLTGDPAPAPPPAEAATATIWYERSVAFYSLGMLDASIAASGKGIALTPTGDDVEDGKLWQLRGLALVRLHRSRDALAALDRALELNPGETTAWEAKGAALNGLNRHREAIGCFDRSLQIAPDYGRAWSNKAAALAQLGSYAESDEAYRHAEQLLPRDAALLEDWAIGLRRQGRHEEALARVARALEISPRRPHAWATRGNLLADLGREQEALGCYDRSLEIDPTDTITLTCRATGLAKLDRYDEADAAYERAAASFTPDTGPDLVCNLYTSWGVNLRNQGRDQEALEHTDRALEAAPGSALAWANRARLLERLGRHAEAVEACAHAQKLSPGDPYAQEIRDLLSSAS